MLYLETKSFEKQIELIEYFLESGEHEVIFWFFRESKKRGICDLKLAPKDLVEGEQVTTYGDGLKPKKTRRVKLDLELVEKIRNSSKEIQSNCDSIVLYKTKETSWIACTIGHEGMCLIKNDELQNALHENGFNALGEPPNWW